MTNDKRRISFRNLALFILISFCISIFSIPFVHGQDPGNKQTGILENLSAQDADVVILNEENDLVFTGESSDFIYYTTTRKVQFKVNNKGGIDKISRFVIPETFDPSYIAHFPPARNYTHVYSRMKMDFFKAEIKTQNGETKEVDLKKDIEDVKMHLLFEDYYGNYQKFIYQINNLEVGDELTVEYRYHLLYTENTRELSGFRIFFHSDIPKLKYNLSIQHHSELVVDYEYINDAEPDDSTIIDKQVKYSWHRENLAGCIDEKGGKPYLSLPHITLKPRPYDLLYIVPHTNEERLRPIYSILAALREKKHFSISVSVLQGVNTRQYQQIDNFIAKETSEIGEDSLGYEKIMKVHHTIVDNFDFKDDLDYFIREDRREPRMGDHLSAMQIRDISRYNIYLALIRKLGLNYFTTYLCDNRSGNISDVFLHPMLHSDFLYTIMLNDEMVVFLYPKKARFGYYLNELPFYYEGSRGRLVHLNDYRHTENPIQEGFREIFMPKGSAGSNTRSTRAMVEIDIENQKAIFNAQVSLSGQFSTMTRGVYQYDYHDETVNPLYGQKIWELNDNVNLISKDIEIKKKEPPFTTTVKTKYQADNIFDIKEDTLRLDISNWFKHIYYHDFDIDGRQMDFHPDFANRDTYSYFIKFDKDISLIQEIENIQINNELATFVINIEQVDSKSIKIDSHFAIGEEVPVEQIEIIKEIYDRIQELNSSRIKLLINP